MGLNIKYINKILLIKVDKYYYFMHKKKIKLLDFFILIKILDVLTVGVTLKNS